ncbi:MAG: tyrosine-type recombinase/integrase [Lachnospiraceae bacterium]|nr:tyrosine-type recombinase/integrase [Lachnospiraceae bacterium]
MKDKVMDSQKYIELLNTLPECTHSYLMTGLSENTLTTKIAYARDIKYFLEFATNYYPYFSDKSIKDITMDDLEKITAEDINVYLFTMKDLGLGEKTRARKKSAISAMFHYMINAQRKLTYNPVSGSTKIRLPEKDFVIYLTMDEQSRLLNTIRTGAGLSKGQLVYHDRYKNRDLAVIFLFLDTGLRVSELSSINVKDFSFDDYTVVVQRKGRNKIQMIYYSDESCEYLRDYLSERKGRGDIFHGDDPFFVTLEGNRLSVREIQQMLKKYVAAALPEKSASISPHKLRSSFAMEFYRNSNKDILTLQKRMGHKSILTTNIYAKAAEAEIKESRNWRNSDPKQ